MSITLYVNGDSHTAGTYTDYYDNFEECFTAVLAKKHNLNYINHALCGGSNTRIIRLSKEDLSKLDPKQTIVLIGWTTFERTEWFEDGEWIQICGQPWYEVKPDLKQRWNELMDWYADAENYTKAAADWYPKIYEFHLWLKEQGFIHRFYHAHQGFPEQIKIEFENKITWPNNVWINDSAFDFSKSFTYRSMSLGYKPDQGFHFDYDAHKAYAEVLEPAVNDMLKELKNT